MAKVTIKDVAKAAGVSVSAVSLVLNNKPSRISEKMRRKIEKTAKEMNYQVNQNARYLVTKESKLLGLIIPDIENTFFSTLCKNIEEYCRSYGYALMIMNSDDHYQNDVELLDLMVNRGVDGIFLTLSNDSFDHQEEMVEKIKGLPVPYVLVDRYYDNFPANKVFFDHASASFEAVKSLIDAGHKKIGCISGPTSNLIARTRFEGYTNALIQAGLLINNDYIIMGNFHFNSGYDNAKKLLDSGVTAVFICNDMMTLGFIKYLNEKKISIPEDISVVSYDNTLALFQQEITAVEQNIPALATSACDVLLAAIQGNEDFQTVRLIPKLIKKGSIKIQV